MTAPPGARTRDVVVVGGGPSGSFAARRCAELGLDGAPAPVKHGGRLVTASAPG